MLPSYLTRKDPASIVLEEKARMDKSPALAGISAGTKAAVLFAPLGAATQALRGKSMRVGALVAGGGAGTLVGLAAATAQKVKNLQTEGEMRYHMRNILEREPMVMIPPAQAMEEAGFNRGFQDVYYPY